ncbi:MAG: sigma 54-interacting transcriptional regulator [Deltaproteobacteria bacterium]|nr:sigma 54-interacting transcriptional regulator [Deltaproteobacteria bacterium]
MPQFTVKTHDGQTKRVPLVKRLTSVGSAVENDLALPDPSVAASAFSVLFDGTGYTASAMGGSLAINGKKRDEHRLAPGDIITVGSTELRFELEDARPPTGDKATAAEVSNAELAALRRLSGFAEQLLGKYEIESLLAALMDQVIAISHADKGFLILLEGGELHVKVARNLDQRNIEDAIARVSDSIVARVVESKKPLIVADALNDEKFKASESVVNLKLCSVMCAPLADKGELFGLIYVGNDRVVSRFDQRSLEMLTVFAAQASLLVKNAMLVNDLKLESAGLKKQLEEISYGEIIGACVGMKDVYKRIDKVATTDISVLITGETGTGKELIARELHRRSPRVKGPFITINCGAIPESLLESELFGHVKGAFTGAIATRAGKFQAAHGGTLFLDEIGEMPTALQVKILRALQERVVVKVGDTRAEPVDIRVVAATNKILEDEIKKGAFREDLYYRLNVVNLKLPPLRERGDDIAVIAKFFMGKYAKEFNSRAKGFSPAALTALRKYAWPGNVRELENRVKKGAVLAERPLLGPEDLELRPENLDPVMPLAQAKEEFQKRYINEVLERNAGNRTKTAKDLGVDPRTIFRHLEKLEAERTGQPLPPDDGPADP